MSSFITKLYSTASFLLSKRINKKIVVFESDDWGSVRMPGFEAYYNCLLNKFPVNENVYTQYDCLESDSDLMSLYDILTKFKDSDSNHPIFTANYLVANPNFHKIIDSGFKDYFYESIEETFHNSKQSKDNLSIIKLGIDNKLFLPQFHGREHLNVSRVTDDLRANNPIIKYAISNYMPGLMHKDKWKKGNEYVVALEHKNLKDLEEKKNIVSEGLELFNKIFGYKPKSFIACNYVWDPSIEDELFAHDVEFIQGSKVQLIPIGNYMGHKFKLHYSGEVNKNKQTYVVRNAHFEPVYGGLYSVNKCLNQIDRAFKFKQAAIISTHRINYVSGMNVKNRENGLRHLEILLKKIIRKWPDVLFMTSVEYGRLLNKYRYEER